MNDTFHDLCSKISKDIQLYDGVALPSKSSINLVSCIGIDTEFSKIAKLIARHIQDLNIRSIKVSIYPKFDSNADIVFIPEEQIDKIKNCTPSVFVLCKYRHVFDQAYKSSLSGTKIINVYNNEPMSIKIQNLSADLRFVVLDRTLEEMDMTYVLDRIDTDDTKHKLLCLVDSNKKLYHGSRYSSMQYSNMTIDKNINAILLINDTGLDSKVVDFILRSLKCNKYLMIIDINRKKLATQLSDIYNTFYRTNESDLDSYAELIELYRSKIIYPDIALNKNRLSALRSNYSIKKNDLDYVDRHRLLYIDTIDNQNKIHLAECKYLDSDNPMWLGKPDGAESKETVLGLADEEEDIMRFYRILETVKYSKKYKREGWPTRSNRQILILSPVFKVGCLADIKYVLNKQSFDCMEKIYLDELDEYIF